MITLDFLHLRAARADLADLGATVRYLRDQGLDLDTVEAVAGGAYLCPTRAVEPRSFSIEDGADLAVVIEARSEDGDDILDLVSWRPAYPARWRTLTGYAPALGMAGAVAACAFDYPLRVWRTPERWLQAGCLGVAILHPGLGARWLLDLAPPAIAAEDGEHAAAIHAERHRLVDASPILVPELEASAP